jgi:hypothetical protein
LQVSGNQSLSLENNSLLAFHNKRIVYRALTFRSVIHSHDDVHASRLQT